MKANHLLPWWYKWLPWVIWLQNFALATYKCLKQQLQIILLGASMIRYCDLQLLVHCNVWYFVTLCLGTRSSNMVGIFFYVPLSLITGPPVLGRIWYQGFFPSNFFTLKICTVFPRSNMAFSQVNESLQTKSCYNIFHKHQLTNYYFFVFINLNVLLFCKDC